MSTTKKFSPQAILALREALSVIYWKKDDLQEFLKLSIENNAILTTVNWSLTKREIVKEVVERMTNRLDIFAVVGISDRQVCKHTNNLVRSPLRLCWYAAKPSALAYQQIARSPLQPNPANLSGASVLPQEAHWCLPVLAVCNRGIQFEENNTLTK